MAPVIRPGDALARSLEGKVSYADFLLQRKQNASAFGFDPLWLPEFLFGFQRDLVEWSVRRGRAAIFADCGLGKTPIQLVWAENVVRHTNKPVLILTPLAVSYQTLKEAAKFGIEAVRVQDGKVPVGARIVATNYERLEHFLPGDFSGVVCDESSILKAFNGVRRRMITEFLRPLKYRLLCTATAAPNDYIELGTHSEALGELGYTDMLSRFFKNDKGSGGAATARYFGKATEWRFKGHAETPFWKWVASWARAVRKPSDVGYDDNGFVLPDLSEQRTIIKATRKRDGFLFDVPAVNLEEQREERRRTIQERCAAVAAKVAPTGQSIIWCHLNQEGDLLERIVPDAVQVSGSDSDDAKEDRLIGFANGDIRVLVTKPKIGAWGLNLQRCSHVCTFPSHSYEQYYQSVRRCWRFGQKLPVIVDIVASEGEVRVIDNMLRKAEQADRMFAALLSHMRDAVRIGGSNGFTTTTEIPTWLSRTRSSTTSTPSTVVTAAS